MKKIEVPEADKIELKKWDALLEISHDFHSFDWFKYIEIDFDTYLTLTNSVIPISLLNIKEDWKVLDIGCGWGRDIKIIREGYGANAIGIDILRRNNDVIAGGRFLCFKDKSFDSVISIVTLQHIPEEKEVLKEIIRVLKPNGKLLLVLMNNSLSNLHYKIGRWHGRLYNAKKLKYMIESLNFEVEVMYLANFSFPLLNRLPKFYKKIFTYEDKLSKMKIARVIAKRIVVIAKQNK